MTTKRKLILLSLLFINLFLVANFTLADDDNEFEDYDRSIIDQVIPDKPLIAVPEAVSSPVKLESTQSASNIITQEILISSVVDSDSDGIIDSIDKYPGKDDFSFNVLDVNKNGIIDEMEYLLNL